MGFINANLLKAIEWSDPNKNTILYKFPMDGRHIQYGSKLTVKESQVAIFMNKGQIADVFGPGMHTLKASNIPILTQLLALPYGFKSPFYADVFFINTKQFTNQKWGTASPITMRDKEFGTIRVRGYGSYAFKVSEPATFLKELAGTNSSYTTEDISDYLRSHLISCISDTIAESKIGALDLSANLKEFSTMALEPAKTEFSALGLTLTKLVIENLSFPPEVEKAIDTRSSVGVMGNVMDDFVKYQSAHAIRDAASSNGAGGVGVELGTGMALGEIMRDSIKSIKEETPKTEAKPKAVIFCPECGAENKKTAKFCNQCGHKLKTTKICPQCNIELPAKAKFCPECGTKL